MYIIETDKLTKKFNNFTAVDGLDLKIEEGGLFGLLGPNGAGKSTTMYMLSTILEPTSGSAKVNGFDVQKEAEEVRKSIGIVFQDHTLDDRLNAYDNLDIHGRLYGIPGPKRAQRIKEVLELVDLQDWARQLVRVFSGGMKRRLEIARGLLQTPKLLFMDEPTLGLDPQTRRHIWEYIQKLRGEGVSIVLSTHYLEEADFLCDKVAIIDHGKIVALDTPANLKNRVQGSFIQIDCPEPQKLLNVIGKSKTVSHANAKITGTLLSFGTPDPAHAIPLLMKLADKAGIKVDSIETHKPSLEDVFIHYTGRSIREEKGSGMEEFARRMHARRT
ncbi:Trehalose/maltose import ATP-binding protein MalK [Candidatus Burarchaeum australiense]|nr:Trehalose/maltose import ATP-binding protein MalK [Candidatus Burarchaeum australiense]